MYMCAYTGFESMLWHVPVTIATSKNPSAVKFVLDKCSETITVDGVGPDDWILVSCFLILLVHGPWTENEVTTGPWCKVIHGKTSDSGPSEAEIETVYNRPLYKGHYLRFQILFTP